MVINKFSLLLKSINRFFAIHLPFEKTLFFFGNKFYKKSITDIYVIFKNSVKLSKSYFKYSIKN